MYFFSLFGIKNVTISFTCPECGGNVFSEDIVLANLFLGEAPEECDEDYYPNDGLSTCQECNKKYISSVLMGFADAYIEIKDTLGDKIEIEEDDINIWLEENIEGYELEAIRDKSNNIYQTFLTGIWNLRKLNAVDLANPELNAILKRQIYTGAVSVMEVYLSDTFINLTLDNEDFLMNYIQSHPEFRQRKFELKDIFEEFKKVKNTAKTVMVDTIYHDLPKVKKMYSSTFDIKLPDLREIRNCVLVRHDLVHRNGKTKNGDAIDLDTITVDSTLNTIENFVKGIAPKIHLVQKNKLETLKTAKKGVEFS